MTQKYIWNSKDWPNFSWNNAALLAPLAEARKAQAELLSIQTLAQDKDKKRIFHSHTVKLTENLLFKWHGDLFLNSREGLKKIAINQFRTDRQRNIEKEVSDFLTWWNEPPLDLDTLLRAGIAHLWLTSIMPFEDGADAILFQVTDLAFAQDEKLSFCLHDLQVQVLNQRDSYFEIIETTQAGNSDITAWLVWFLKAFTASCQAPADVIAQSLCTVRFWQKHQALDLNARQRKILNYLLTEENATTITNKFCVSLCDSNREALKRDLSGLVKLQILKTSGQGRGVCYKLNA